mmetsp:Transcript_8762/g.19658  ORF Transcript_8762/g.19658 Transcript_8762/m.19658 type:complete len:829 (+) Transcript_8762:186-2672(+)
MQKDPDDSRPLHGLRGFSHVINSARRLSTVAMDIDGTNATSVSTLFDNTNTTIIVVQEPPITSNIPPSNEAASAPSTEHSFLLPLLLFLMFLPFIAAAVAQTIYCFKKRQRDRIERELSAMNAHPNGRRLILDVLFKENSRPVTEEECSPKKKRVLVKKRRKKTPHEQRGSDGIDRSASMDDEEGGVAIDGSTGRKRPSILSGAWWGEERVTSLSDSRIMGDSDDDEGSKTCDESEDHLVICIRSPQTTLVGYSSDPVGMTVGEGNMSATNHARHCFNTRSADVIDDFASKKEECSVINEDERTEVVDDTTTATNTSRDDSIIQDVQSSEDNVGNYSPLKSDDYCISNANKTRDFELEGDSEGIGREEPIAPCAIFLEPQVTQPPGEMINRVCSTTDSLNTTTKTVQEGPVGVLSRDTDQPTFGLILPDLSTLDETGDAEKTPAAELVRISRPPSIFRKASLDVTPREMEIQPSSSTVTEAASNIADDCFVQSDAKASTIAGDFKATDILPSHIHDNSISERSNTSNLGGPFQLNPVPSSVTDASSISYFSYEDVSLEDEEAEICAVCLSSYEEGDIRIFSKHCSHVFHKECVFEWLVLGHNECPCCRADMVTKDEIKETSKTLIGSESLAQAMQSGMVEAPPLARGHRLTRQMLARARAARRQSARFVDSRRLSTNGGTSPIQTTPASPSTPVASNTNTHYNDWLWATRFEANTISGSQPLASRSSDAISDPRQTNNQSEAVDEHHHSTAGALHSSTSLHDNWTSPSHRNTSRSQSGAHARQVTLTPFSNRHPHWQRTNRRDLSPPLIEIQPRPAMSLSTSATSNAP